ncbi:Protein of unknown function [Solimonas aquatica]|uniref:DUF1214 domain-containing protein n=1 Tax=Solimonas aquatica TaxID=489703 RepID=A0A1H9EYH1_9GAMM|nr:DUF1214 domain-containing protein [Solimonas aquatica]SEQ30712.1 Protein of unknown function [Solimonas aquatica]
MSVEQEVLSGQVWSEFCEQLKRAGQQILRPETPATALDRAEGWRYLTRLLRIGLEMHLEYADADFPGFFLPSHETGKIGADNPDNAYLFARINGHHDYLIRGRRGTVPYLSFGSQKGGYETDGKMEQTGFLDGRELQLDADGGFELHLSQTPRPGNWLRLEPESNAVIVRQTFNDRSRETAAQMRIERAGAGAQPQPLSAQRIAQNLKKVAGFVEGTATVFANWAQGYLEHENQLPPANQAVCQAAGGDPNIFYYHSAWRLEEDQALVIRLPRIPECRFWNLQIDNWWMESLDYRYHRIHLNAHSAQRAADGSVTMVLAHRDPGHPNWLETAGHRRGTLCLRWVAAREHVHPSTQLLSFSELPQVLAA